MSGGNILVVEDEGLIALHLMELLSKEGFTIPDPVANGEDLLEKLATSPPPDVILMDIGLGGKIDGIETARRMKKKYNIPVIFLTAYSDQNRMEEARQITSCGYLMKPVMQRDLLIALGNALRNRERVPPSGADPVHGSPHDEKTHVISGSD
jgi:DNA-binding response OmpR family regulator